MATKPFKNQPMFPLGPDTTEYYKLTSDYVKVENWGGHEFLVVDPQALTVLARACTHDNAFMLRREHNEMVAKILSDPEASENDKFVALTMLRNAEVASSPSARTPARPSATARKARTSTQAVTTRSASRRASISHIPLTTCATRRTPPSQCMTR